MTPAVRVCFAVLVLQKFPLTAGSIAGEPPDPPADLLAAAGPV